MTCTCAYYEPGLISYENPKCPEHGDEAKKKAEEARELTRQKLRDAGVTEWDLRAIGFFPNGSRARL